MGTLNKVGGPPLVLAEALQRLSRPVAQGTLSLLVCLQHLSLTVNWSIFSKVLMASMQS